MASGLCSEREEGELSEAEDLSDISSEEEYLLRQRLQVLENYNNVLERKEAKRQFGVSQGTKSTEVFDVLLPDLSDISGSELDGNIKIKITNNKVTKKVTKKPKSLKSSRKRNHQRNHNPGSQKYEKLPKQDSHIKKVTVRKSNDKYYKDKHKKKHEIKKIIESSDESDYEYRNKRRRLQNAVNITNTKTDYTTLKTRLMNMFADKTNVSETNPCIENLQEKEAMIRSVEPCSIVEETSVDFVALNVEEDKSTAEQITDIVILSTDEDAKSRNDSSYEIINIGSVESNKSNIADNNYIKDVNSDEDLEVLRQYALKTKSIKKPDLPVHHISESEDSDTAELRLICLRSTLLKKAMEMKQKKKLRKRIATMSSIDDVLMSKLEDALSDQSSERSRGNTDIESVDMDTGISEGSNMDDNVFKLDNVPCKRANSKTKEKVEHHNIAEKQHNPGQVMKARLGSKEHIESEIDAGNLRNQSSIGSIGKINIEEENCVDPQLDTATTVQQKFENKNALENNKSDTLNIFHVQCVNSRDLLKDEEMEEDEDLLRAKLLNSLTHNLNKLCENEDIPKSEDLNSSKNIESKKVINTENKDGATKRFVINIGNSDSGSDNETTKNLKKMHMKLSENNDFEQRLDIFLKSARKEAEENAPVHVDQVTAPDQRSPEKFVPKALNHLPKSGQLEYKRLVKRMAELEKLKQSRQATLNRASNTATTTKHLDKNMKITIKSNEPRIVTEDTSNTIPINQVQLAQDFETEIAMSRKRIAAESSKVLKLKEESNQLSQRYKMVVAELRNVRTAMIFNKREVNTVQASLAKMRSQHQLLLNRSTALSSSKVVNSASYGKTYSKPDAPTSVGGRERTKDNLNNVSVLQMVRVSIVNDLQEKKNIPERNVSVQLDFNKNRKVTLPAEKSTSDSTLTCGEKENYEPMRTVEIMHKKCTLETNVARSVSKSVNGPDTSLKTDNQIEQTDACSSRSENIFVPEEEREKSCESNIRSSKCELDDYKSPLVSMVSDVSWNEDPHGVLCPYEVGGSCKDSECKYLHAQPARH